MTAASGVIYPFANGSPISPGASITLDHLFSFSGVVTTFDVKVRTNGGGYLLSPTNVKYGFDQIADGISVSQLGQWKFVASSVADVADQIGFDANAGAAYDPATSSNATSIVFTGSNIVQGIDFPLTTSSHNLSLLTGAGYKFVIRYYCNDGSETILTNTERVALENAHLQVCAVWENKNNQINLNLGAFSDGGSDARAAIQQANSAQQEGGSAIYFAVDADWTSTTIDTYFAQIRAVFNDSTVNTNHYRIGVYGSGHVCNTVISERSADLAWLASAAYSWTDTKTDNAWNISQVGTTDKNTVPISNIDPYNKLVAGDFVGVDVDLAKGDFGQFGYGVVSGDTQAPTFGNDNPLSVAVGGTGTITSSLLSSNDNVSSGANLRYTVTSGPTDGTLLLNGSATTSFTQADINNGLVTYRETVAVASATTDQFFFKVSDAAGNSTGTVPFQISISVSSTTIESAGVTSLTQIGNNFFLYANGTTSGPELKLNGTAVVAGQYPGWTVIGGEHTSTGYEVAWKNASTGQYTIWTTDSNGNYVSNVMGAVTGADSTLQSHETLFQQDLNGDGHIGAGVSSTTIESAGVTSLTQVGNNYFLYANGTTTGPELMLNGVAVVVGQYSGWALIGGEHTSTGYEVAWKNASTGQYTIWTTDSNGNYVSNVMGVVTGSDSTLQSHETLFQQDLNGDGHIGAGVSSTTIESAGVTSLTQVGNNYFLYANGTTSGPELKLNGAPVVAGQYSGWALIGGEHTSTGYEVAWKNASTGQYTIWTTDSNGNYVSNVMGVVTGSDSTLQSHETLFQQDLNGDGHIGAGVSSTTIESAGVTSLTQVGNNYFLYANGTTSGPELKLNGAPVVVGQYSGWALIGGEHTSTGYEVAWKNASTGQYTIWTTDSNGNYVSNVMGVVTGSDSTLQSHETLFQQDLNGDGHIGPGGAASSVIESFGTTSLTQVGNNYYLYANGTTSGPELKLNGAPIVAGQYPGWTVIGGEHTSTGYEVAWKNASTGQYTIWTTDSNGNYTQNAVGLVTGSDSSLQLHETVFQQDLNGDGRIGPAPVVMQPGAEGQDLWITNFYSYNDDYGVNNEQLRVGGWGDVYDSLIKFDLSGVNATHVSSATIQLYNLADGGNPTGLSVEELQRGWDETYGWYSYGGVRPSTLGAATADPPNLPFNHLTNVAAPNGAGWVTIDVTSAVNDWLANPSSNFGVLIRPLAHDNNNFDDFVSSDATGANAQFHPMLVLHPDLLV